MFKIYCGNKVIHDVTDGSNDHLVWNISLTRKVNDPDILTFVIHDTHEYSEYIYPNCEEIRVEKIEKHIPDPLNIHDTQEYDTENIFYGRVLSTSINLHGERTVTCESELGYLLDSITPPFSMKNTTNTDVISFLLTQHRNQVGSGGAIDKKIYLKHPTKETDHPSDAFDLPYIAAYDANNDGQIFADDGRLILRDSVRIWNTDAAVLDPPYDTSANFSEVEKPAAQRRYDLADDIIDWSRHAASGQRWTRNSFNWSSSGNEKTLEVIKRNFTDVYGGFLYIEHVVHNGQECRVLRYKSINEGQQPFDSTTPTVTLDNLIDITYDKSAEERFSIVYPLGAEITETNSLDVRALNGKTWLVFGDANTVCKPNNIAVDISNGNAYTYDMAANISEGQIARIDDANYSDNTNGDSYTGYLAANGTRYQKNKHTQGGESYVNLLTSGARMKTITLAEETETIFKHSGHEVASGSGTKWVQDWDNEGDISTNQDKSVVERLYDLFGQAFINPASEDDIAYTDSEGSVRYIMPDGSVRYRGVDGTIRQVTSKTAWNMVLKYDLDHPHEPMTGIRKCDFVTVAVGLYDWLNADSVLGTNEMGIKHSAYLDAAGFTANNLHEWCSTTAIEDYIDTNKYGRNSQGQPTTEMDPKDQTYYDEDGKRIEFKKSMYWQIRFMCMYLKACFPQSHIIILSSFGKKTSKKEGTDKENDVGCKGWYVPDGTTVAGATSRTRTEFYREKLIDPYMKSPDDSESMTEEWDDVQGGEPPENPGGVPYRFVKFVDDYGHVTWYEKVHIHGKYSKTTKTDYTIFSAGQNPSRLVNPNDEDYLAWAKVSVKKEVPVEDSGSSSGVSGGSSGNENVPQPGENSEPVGGEPELAGEGGEGEGEQQTTEKSFPYLAYLSKWSTEKPGDGGIIAGRWAGESGGSLAAIENAPDIIHSPYTVLKENSYSISDLNSAISEICEEYGITYVDSESEAGISVDNYGEIKETELDPQTVPPTFIADVSAAHYDNLIYVDENDEPTGGSGTYVGVWGESFVGGAYLNNRGQRAMARAVRNAMLNCLTESGEIEEIERLAISGSEKPYYSNIMIDMARDSDTGTIIKSDLDLKVWRAMKIVASGRLVKMDGVYDRKDDGAKMTRKTHPETTNGEWKDQKGYGLYDLTDGYGNYNPKAFEDLDLTGLVKNDDMTALLVPVAPGDPIVAVAEFENATTQQDLFYAAAAYLYDNYSQNTVNITVKAIDMRVINILDDVYSTIPAMKIGNIVWITAMNYGLYKAPFVVDTIIESDDPADTIITFKSVGGGSYSNEQLAANPYGAHNKRNAIFMKLSELISKGGR